MGQLNSTSHTRPKRSPSTIRALIKTCLAIAGASFLRWSRRGAGMQATSFRMGHERRENSSTPCATVHRGRRSMSCGADSCSVQLLIGRFVEPLRRSYEVSREKTVGPITLGPVSSQRVTLR